MDAVRYYVALMVLIALPPGLGLWFAIHPFVRFWRRLGPGWTYTILALPVAGIMSGIFGARHFLLATDFGTQIPLVALSVLCLAAGLALFLKRQKQLSVKILVGVQELSPPEKPGKLLTEGIYSVIRHPRYVEILFWTLAYTLFANYLAVYIMFVLTLPTIYLIVLLEERELRDRFGEAYEAYCRRVPRFVPRRAPIPYSQESTATDDTKIHQGENDEP